MFAVALKMVGDDNAASDIVQEVFICLFKRLNNGNVIHHLNTWLYIYGRPMGLRKSLRIMPDGSVVVNHAYRNYYTKFTPDGDFEKEFGITNRNGRQFEKIKSIEGIINDNTFFTGLDNMGNMICFDFDGNHVKTLKLDYSARQMVPMPNNKIAVSGWVQWRTRFRELPENLPATVLLSPMITTWK